MDRETWKQILMLAVLAPYVYTLSDEEKNSYFKLGLKLVAGAIAIDAIMPLFVKAQPLVQAAVKLQQEKESLASFKKDSAVEGEFVEAPNKK